MPLKINQSPKLTDEEILKEQAEREKEMSKIVNTFSEIRKGNGFIYELECKELADGSIGFQKIKIFKKNQLHQKIDVDTIEVINRNYIVLNVDEDVNFDGENDIELLSWSGMYSTSSSFWLFDKKTKKYRHYPSLDKIIDPRIDKKSKQITSDYHVGPGDFFEEIYEWKKGKLIKVYESHSNEPRIAPVK